MNTQFPNRTPEQGICKNCNHNSDGWCNNRVVFGDKLPYTLYNNTQECEGHSEEKVK